MRKVLSTLMIAGHAGVVGPVSGASVIKLPIPAELFHQIQRGARITHEFLTAPK